MIVNATPTRLVVILRVKFRDGYVNKELYEGELPVSDQANLKALLGDGKARVTVSRELSESDFGDGGKVFVSVTLSCDQSLEGIDAAAGWANHLVDKYSREFHPQLRGVLAEKGILVR